MVDKIAFQSIGLIEGIYLPSAENPRYGSLLTEHGIFPAEPSRKVSRKYRYFARPSVKKEPSTLKLKFLAWMIGIEDAPYYKLDLRAIYDKCPKWLDRENRFDLQGIITEHSAERTVLKVQRNAWQNCSEADILASTNYITIKNCPKGIRKSQFWYFNANLNDGYLNCLSATRIANATEAKKALKAWQTDPVPSSQHKELLSQIKLNQVAMLV